LSAAVVARTEHIRVFHTTLNIPYRFAGVLAKEAATLDIISNGRLDLCLGAGGEANRPLYDSIGVPLAGPGDRLRNLRDYIAILRGLWANEKFSYEGRTARVVDAAGGPKPVQQPIPIWVGALQPRSLRLAGQLADGFMKNQGWTDAASMRELNKAVDAAALEAGRDPKQIRRVINGPAYVAENEKDAEEFRKKASQVPGGTPSSGGLIGTASEILAQVRAYRQAGVDTFNVRFQPSMAAEQIQRFGEQIIPEASAL